jgi:hypothetical protein
MGAGTGGQRLCVVVGGYTTNIRPSSLRACLSKYMHGILHLAGRHHKTDLETCEDAQYLMTFRT